MKKILSLFALLMTIVIGAKAADESAILYWESTQSSANSIQIGDFTLAITGNTGKNWSNGNGNITIGSTSYKTLKNSNGAQNTITCPDGYVATGITFYAVTNDDKTKGKLSELDGTSCTDEVSSLKDYSNPTVISKNIGEKESFTFTFSTKQVCFIAVVTYKASAPATSPDITTQPEDVTYIKGSETCDNMTVEATPLNPGDILGYQWQYSLNGETFNEIPTLLVPSAEDPTLIGTEAIALIKNMSSIPDQVYIRCVVSETGAEDAISNVANVYIVDGEAPTISIEAKDDVTLSLKGGSYVKLIATATGSPAPTIQWYSKNGGITTLIEGATGAEFTPSTTEYGTFEYLAKATNGVSSADSDPIAITVKPALESVKFSNGVYGAIKEPTVATENGTIEVPYTYGTDEPTLIADYIQVYNDVDAQIGLDENTIDVISGDISATYDIEYVSVGAKEVTEDIEGTFSSADIGDWVFNKYGYEWSETDASKQKGMKFAKAVNDAVAVFNMRIAKGNTRQYYFVGPAKSMTLTAVTSVAGKSSIRKVNLYVNGTLIQSDVNNNELGTITLDETGTNLVMIESAQTGGDGGFSGYSIKAATIPTVTLNSDGFATYSSAQKVKVNTDGVDVYYASGIEGNYLTLEKKTNNIVNIDEGVVLYGTAGTEVEFVKSEEPSDPLPSNLLLPTTTSSGTASVPGTNNPTTWESDALTLDGHTFKWYDKKVFTPNRAYIERSSVVNESNSLILVFKDSETAVDAIAEANEATEAPVKVVKNGQLYIGNYNVAGQQVK